MPKTATTKRARTGPKTPRHRNGSKHDGSVVGTTAGVSASQASGFLSSMHSNDKASTAPPSIESHLNSMRGSGQALPESSRSFFESRFGMDFSQVRVHTDAKAAETAQAMNAAAYTVGKDVVFGQGQYAPEKTEGKKLLAHELTHVAQQSAGMNPDGSFGKTSAPAQRVQRLTITPWHGMPRISRAYFNVGAQTVQIDYGNIVAIPTSDYESAVETRFTAWTGSPAATIHAALTALAPSQKQWVLFALDLLIDNTTAAHAGLDRVKAVERIIAHAPASTFHPLGTASTDFENEVLRVSGWFEAALAAGLTTPTGATLATITGLYNPPPASAAGVLDVARLNSDLPPALTALLNSLDPANWPATGTHSLGTLQSIGDRIQDQARTFFRPYADTAISNQYSAGWRYSAKLVSVTTMSPTKSQRLGYLTNRAEIVGRQDRPGGSIFSNANFDSSRAADRTELFKIVTTMEADSTIEAIVDRLIQHTGRANPATKTVGISTEFNLDSTTECEARWRAIDTLCHELVHVLVHPNFPNRATGIRFGQIVREGFTEVLGVQLFESLRAKAASDAAFKAQMEAGLAAAPCPAPAAATIGYGQAGTSAERIRGLVGNDNFRAAYFLGAVDRVGL